MKTILDVSFNEYARNDRSAFPQAAMTESEKLIVGMEKDVNPMPLDTPLVNNAARLRPDLWGRDSALRGHARWQCAQQKAACAEVELVHAGNEINQQQWRHAKPCVQIAEDLLGEARELADACLPPPVPPPPPRTRTRRQGAAARGLTARAGATATTAAGATGGTGAQDPA